MSPFWTHSFFRNFCAYAWIIYPRSKRILIGAATKLSLIPSNIDVSDDSAHTIRQNASKSQEHESVLIGAAIGMLTVPICLFLMPSWGFFLGHILELRTLQLLFCADIVTYLVSCGIVNFAFIRHQILTSWENIQSIENLPLSGHGRRLLAEMRTIFLSWTETSFDIFFFTLYFFYFWDTSILRAYFNSIGIMLCGRMLIKSSAIVSWPNPLNLRERIGIFASYIPEALNLIISPILLTGALKVPFTLVISACQGFMMIYSSSLFIASSYCTSRLALSYVTIALRVNYWLQEHLDNMCKASFQVIGNGVIKAYDAVISMICLISDNFQNYCSHSISHCYQAVSLAEISRRSTNPFLLIDHNYSNTERAIAALNRAIDHTHRILRHIAHPPVWYIPDHPSL